LSLVPSCYLLTSYTGRLVSKPTSSQPKAAACPLTSVEADVTIKDFCASIVISQQFANAESVPIEAVYQVI